MIFLAKIVIVVGEPLPKAMSHKATFDKKQMPTMRCGFGKKDESVAVAGPSTSGESSLSPKIFKLTIDCFDEIFEYLSKLFAIHSINFVELFF